MSENLAHLAQTWPVAFWNVPICSHSKVRMRGLEARLRETPHTHANHRNPRKSGGFSLCRNSVNRSQLRRPPGTFAGTSSPTWPGVGPSLAHGIDPRKGDH